MAFEFALPDIGEGVVEGEIVAWKVKVGEKVTLDQPIVEIMTDKATVEIPSPRAGTVSKINFKDGDTCPVGAVLLEIEEDGKPATTPPPPSGNGHGQPAPPPVAAASHAPATVATARGSIASPGPGRAASPEATRSMIEVVDVS
ncbi:MAG TPA: biotin/lipoyl-containing protein, partial [Kofleriaceae bacterium]